MKLSRMVALATALVLGACSVETRTEPEDAGSAVSELMPFRSKTHVPGSPGYCGPYFAVIPEATLNKKLDIIIFSLKGKMIDGVLMSLRLAVTPDRLTIVVDDTKAVPEAQIDLGSTHEIRISRKDLDLATCLAPGRRI